MSIVTNATYGALELKRAYQKNMLLGSLCSVTLTAIIFAGIWIYLALQPPPPEPVGDGDNGGGYFDSLRIVERDKITFTDPSETGPVVPRRIPAGIIKEKPVFVDIEDPDTSKVYPPIDYPGTSGGNSGPYAAAPNGTGSQGGGIPGGRHDIPSSNDFIPFEQAPEIVSQARPEYPKLARDAGLGGFVIIQAFVDKSGKVLKAQIAKCSRPGIGFEESALAAAYKCVYRPAIQNGNPVGVWISYKVQFTMENDSK